MHDQGPHKLVDSFLELPSLISLIFTIILILGAMNNYMKRRSSVVECWTRNRFKGLAFPFSPRRPSPLSCINEYLAIDGGGHVSELSLSVIAAWLESIPEKSRWCRDDQVCQGRKSVERCERSNGLDTALYKNIPFLYNSHVCLWLQNFCEAVVPLIEESSQLKAIVSCMTVLIPSSTIPSTVMEGLMEQIMFANRIRQQKGSKLQVTMSYLVSVLVSVILT